MSRRVRKFGKPDKNRLGRAHFKSSPVYGYGMNTTKIFKASHQKLLILNASSAVFGYDW